MASRSWEPQYTIEDAAESLLAQINHHVQQAYDLVAQVEAMKQLAGLTDEEKEMSRDEAEEQGILEQLMQKSALVQRLYRAENAIKTAGQGDRRYVDTIN